MNSESASRMREMPPVHEVLAHPLVDALISERGREAVVEWVRVVLDQIRWQLSQDGLSATRDDLTDLVSRTVRERAESEFATRLGKVINATGIVLHTSLGRAPLSDSAVEAVRECAAACNLEVDLNTGDRRQRGSQLQGVWRTLTGCEGALIVNNNAAATVLALQALCHGKEVILSRGQLIEIGGSFRLPEIFAQSGAILREVGTTNRTYLRDYRDAIGPNTAAILRVHPSNYRIEGFSETPETRDLAALARKHGLLCIDDIGSGCLVNTTKFGLPTEPTFQGSLTAGADLVLGSGDKLLGGPQCGILLGGAELIEKLREHPLARAVRVDKLKLAALAATLDAYVRGTAEKEIPTLAMLGVSAEELEVRARRIRDGVTRCEPGHPGAHAPRLPGIAIEVVSDSACVGGGSLPGAELPTVAIKLQHPTQSAEALARRLRLGQPRVFGRIQDDAVLLDLRSVAPQEDEQIILSLCALNPAPAGQG